VEEQQYLLVDGKMIPAIIFSRNRAMQLDALLRSMEHYAHGVFGPVYALLRYDTPEYRQAYGKVARIPHSCLIARGEDLRGMLLQYLAKDGPVVMFADDDIFYRPVTNTAIPEDALCYSLRLGKNTTYSYCAGKDQKEGELDFIYPWSIDGHIYRSRQLRDAIASISDFSTPTQMEARLHVEVKDRLGSKVAYGEHSCLVNIAHNAVQTEYKNRNPLHSYEELNQQFLKGERINFLSMDFSGVCGCHQEIPFVFQETA
jgi:hypothetical protein